LISNFGLLKQVGRALLNSLLLRSVIENVVSDLLGLSVQRHDTLFKDKHLLVHVSLLRVHSG